MKYFAIALVFTLTSSVSAFEKSGTTSLQFLSVRPSARAAALGGAFTTAVDNSDACFWNPAALTKIASSDVSLNYIDYFLDVKMYSFSAAYTHSDWGTFGVFGLYSDVGEIDVTRVNVAGKEPDGTYNPGLTGETIRPYQLVAGLSYAKEMTKAFSFGLNAKFAEEDLIYNKIQTVMFDGGIHFKTGYRSIEIGAAVKNFGADVKFYDKKFPIPQTLNIGISANVIGEKDKNLLMDSEDNTLLLAYDIVQLRDYDQQHSVGCEYTFKNMFSLRGGYKFNGDQESYSFGCGINVSKIRFDYSYSAFGDYLPAVHRLTIGYCLK
jgi:hypothetical protein